LTECSKPAGGEWGDLATVEKEGKNPSTETGHEFTRWDKVAARIDHGKWERKGKKK